ncbi:MAG: ComEC/Rec2 family competence protein [Clostridia bacterium]|nr:ComEC/Rec2 family competence protein [Clostridia bacterium]
MILRPFALVGFSFTLTFLALCLFDGALPVVAVAVAACLLICLLARNMSGKNTVVVALLCVICACVFFSIYEVFTYSSAISMAGSGKTVRAQIISLPEKSEKGFFYTLRSSCIDGEAAEYKISLFSRELIDAEPYDEVEFKAELYSVEDADTASYYKPKAIFLQCFWHSKIKVISSTEKPFGFYLLKAKDYCIRRLGSVMKAEPAALATAMLTGDKSGMSNEAVAAFKSAGLSHTTAVSGLHMSIIVMGLYKLLNLISRRFIWLNGLVCIAVSFVYAGVSGFSMSAVRSCVMIAILLLGSMLGRRADSLNSLGVAALVITLGNPFAVLDWSFMLSFSATLGMVLCSKYINLLSGMVSQKIPYRPLRYLVRTVISTALISLTATAFCLPVTLFFVESISTVFIPANLLTLYAVSAVLVLSLLLLVPMGDLTNIIALPCEAICRYMLRAAQALSEFDYSLVSTQSPVIKVSFVGIAAVIGLAGFVIKDKRKFAKTVVVTALFTVLVNIVIHIISVLTEV